MPKYNKTGKSPRRTRPKQPAQTRSKQPTKPQHKPAPARAYNPKFPRPRRGLIEADPRDPRQLRLPLNIADEVAEAGDRGLAP
jgi:hypothetical protein